MFLPSPLPSNHASHSTYAQAKSGLPTGDWSSLIGIVTAICGNVLISFALNTQRYAHIRLSRQREDDKEKQKANGGHLRKNGHDSSQETIAEQREAANLKRVDGDEETYSLAEPTEEDALIPHVHANRSNTDEHENEDTENNQDKGKTYLKSPVWWLGIALMILGEAGNFLAYGFAPASIVSPLGVVALVSNCLIAPLLLGEEFRWRDGMGVIIAIAGCVTVVLSASSSNPKLSADSIWHLITRWEFETYFGITVFLIAVLSIASNRFGDRTILIDVGLVGLYGGYTALSTKGIASLLSNKVWRVITFPITYLLLAVLVTTAVMQIKYINRALQRFNATMVIPTQFVLFTLSVIIGSAILYRDFERETTEDAIKFVGGCALTFLGVWCITSGRSRDDENEHGDDEDDSDEQARIELIDEETPHLRRATTSASVAPSVIVTSASRDDTAVEPSTMLKTAGAAPANVSAVHTQTAAAVENTPDHPMIHATTSEPLIPTQKSIAANDRSRTPLSRQNSNSSYIRRAGSGQTPNRKDSSNSPLLSAVAPQTPQQVRRLPSSAGLIPAPLTSTLSSSLSAIVADSLRRGVDNYSSQSPSSIRRRPSSIKRAQTRRGLTSALFSGEDASTEAPLTQRHSITSGEAADVAPRSDAEGEPLIKRSASQSVTRRMRSLSATLGDLFGGTSRTDDTSAR